jgi:hypothetical protein
MRIGRDFHLTYCTNVHPGEGWREVLDSLNTHLPNIRKGVCSPSEPFGLGLRLSAQAAEELLAHPPHLDLFRSMLAEQRAYVFTINGFPYGRFHGTRVKEQVYLPDWRDDERLIYSNRLALLLTMLMADESQMEGTVSTVPCAFKPTVRGAEEVERIVEQLLRHVAYLHRLKQETGRTISLALEPEPGCYLETIGEVKRFFDGHLFSGPALGQLARELGRPIDAAREIVRQHLGVCFDACHMAVAYEDPVEAVAVLVEAGIKICKVQVSAALRLIFREGDGTAARLLTPFAEDTYLHQTVECRDGRTVRFMDLPEALAAEARAGENRGLKKEWRVHFHVPIFLAQAGLCLTTQDFLVTLLAYLKSKAICRYLEVETYTWDVLPQEYRFVDVAEAIARELNWARERLA